jgi:hypothetical protein
VHGSTVTVVTSQGGAAYTLAPSGSGVKTTFAGQTLNVAPTSTASHKKVHKAHKHKHEHDVATVTKSAFLEFVFYFSSSTDMSFFSCPWKGRDRGQSWWIVDDSGY